MGEGMSDGVLDPVVVENPDGAGRIVIVCDHASNRIPAEYAAFGFAEDALQTHIAWDPGALAVARLLSAEIPTIVCCSNGMSRSPALAAGAIHVAHGVPLHEALQLATIGGHDVSPALWRDVELSFSP